MEVRRVAHEVNGSSHGARAVERALRAAQHFDPIHVEEARLGRARGIDVQDIDGHIIEVNAGGGGARLRRDAADLDVRLAGAPVARIGEIRDRTRQLLVVRDVLLLEGGGGHRGDADGCLAQRLAGFLGGHDDFAELVRGVALGCEGGDGGRGQRGGCKRDQGFHGAHSPGLGKGWNSALSRPKARGPTTARASGVRSNGWQGRASTATRWP